jgi:PAS domain-containing protein
MSSSVESPGGTQQLRARIAALEQERDVLKQIVERSPLMVAILRAPDFVFEFVNPAFRELTAGTQLIGQRYADVWSEVVGQPVETLQNVIATERAFHREDAPWRIQRGSDRSMTYSLIPLAGPGGKADRILMVAEETEAVRRRQAGMGQELPGK